MVTGLCGALGAHRAGAILLYREVVDDAGVLRCDDALLARLGRALPGAALVRACTAGRVVTTAAERAALAARFDAGAVDMEATHLARALAARAIPFAMVRVASDDASRDLPPIGDAIDTGGSLHAGRLAVAFARSPRAALEFVRGVVGALRALRALVASLSAA